MESAKRVVIDIWEANKGLERCGDELARGCMGWELLRMT